MRNRVNAHIPALFKKGKICYNKINGKDKTNTNVFFDDNNETSGVPAGHEGTEPPSANDMMAERLGDVDNNDPSEVATAADEVMDAGLGFVSQMMDW